MLVENPGGELNLAKDVMPKYTINTPLAFHPHHLSQEVMAELNQIEGMEWVVPKLQNEAEVRKLNEMLPALTAVHTLRFTEDYNKDGRSMYIPTLTLPPHIRQITFHDAFSAFDYYQPTIEFKPTPAANMSLVHVVDLAFIDDNFFTASIQNIVKSNAFPSNSNDNLRGKFATILVHFYGEFHEHQSNNTAHLAHLSLALSFEKVLRTIFEETTQQYILCDLPYCFEPHKDYKTRKNHEGITIQQAIKKNLDHNFMIIDLITNFHKQLSKDLENPENLIKHPKLKRHYTRQDTIHEVLSRTITPTNLDGNLLLNALKAAFPDNSIEHKQLTNLTADTLKDTLIAMADQLSKAGKYLVLHTTEKKNWFGQKSFKMAAEIRDLTPKLA